LLFTSLNDRQLSVNHKGLKINGITVAIPKLL
jgi:hypothetical protein